MPKLPELSPEDLEKVKRLKGESSDLKKISPEMYLLAEFGYFFGWDGILAIENEVISLSKAIELLEGMRVVEGRKLYEKAKAMFYATKDAKAFNKAMSSYANNSRIEE